MDTLNHDEMNFKYTSFFRVRPLREARQHVRLIGDDPLSKQTCFSWGVRGSMALKMLLYYDDDTLP
jgi:hypothetical protein